MFMAVIAAVHERVVLDGMQRSVLLWAYAARRMSAIVAAPHLLVSHARQPLLHRDRSEIRDMLHGLASSAGVVRVVCRMPFLRHTPRTLRSKHDLLHLPVYEHLINKVVLWPFALAGSVAEDQSCVLQGTRVARTCLALDRFCCKAGP